MQITRAAFPQGLIAPFFFYFRRLRHKVKVDVFASGAKACDKHVFDMVNGLEGVHHTGDHAFPTRQNARGGERIGTRPSVASSRKDRMPGEDGTRVEKCEPVSAALEDPIFDFTFVAKGQSLIAVALWHPTSFQQIC